MESESYDGGRQQILNLSKKTENRMIYGSWIIFMDEMLGKGGFSTVFKGQNKYTKDPVAIKRIELDKIKNLKLFKKIVDNEINLMKSCREVDNPFLLKIHDYFTPGDKTGIAYLVLEFCNRGSLRDELKKCKGGFREDKALTIAYQILIGLKAISDLNIIHRDLKPGNILVHEDEKTGLKTYKIGDFGLAKKGRKFKELSGTARFMAPENFIDHPEHLEEYGEKKKDEPVGEKRKLTKAVDVWAFGLIIDEMLFASSPFNRFGHKKSKNEIIRRIIYNEYKICKPPKFRNIKPTTKDMLKRCIRRKPKLRITVESLLKHHCFKFCRQGIIERGRDVEKIIGPYGWFMKTEVTDYSEIQKIEENNWKKGKQETKSTKITEQIEEISARDQVDICVKILSKSLQDYRDINLLIFETSALLEVKLNQFDKELSRILLHRALERTHNIMKILKMKKIPEMFEEEIFPFSFEVKLNQKIWDIYLKSPEFWSLHDDVFRDLYETEDAIVFRNEKICKSRLENFNEQEKELNILWEKIELKLRLFCENQNLNWNLKMMVKLLLIYNYEKFVKYLPLNYKIENITDCLDDLDEREELLEFIQDGCILKIEGEEIFSVGNVIGEVERLLNL